MKALAQLSTITALMLSASGICADWDNFPIPATPPEGTQWQLTEMSDEFNYTAPADGKSEEFYSRWTEGFINDWTGPGLTEWNPNYSEVRDGYLRITTGRNQENGNVFAGSITSKQSFTYPMYMEVRAKISNMVTASNFWALSKDSTQEIDVLEAYGSDREGQEWFAERLHLSHHVFIREPFQDYQPKTDDTWYARDGIKWKDAFHTIGVYWRDPWHLEYYVDGEFIKSSSGKGIIDPLDYTEGTGLTKPMQAIINTESHAWRSDQGIAPTDEEMNDPERNLYLVDWVRFYKPVSQYQTDNQQMWQSGEAKSIEFASFDATGKDGPAIDSDTIEGFNPAGDNINYNTLGDWAEYTIDFESGGYYRIDYTIASPATGSIGAEFYLNDELISSTAFTGTGDWETYQTFSEVTPLNIPNEGSYKIKVKSVGTEQWQWNGDEFQLVALIPTEQNDLAGSGDTPDDSAGDGSEDGSGGSDDQDTGGDADDNNSSDNNSSDNNSSDNNSSNDNSSGDSTNDNDSGADSTDNDSSSSDSSDSSDDSSGDTNDSASSGDETSDSTNEDNQQTNSSSGGAMSSSLTLLAVLFALRRRLVCGLEKEVF